jgi:hypothetical protein
MKKTNPESFVKQSVNCHRHTIVTGKCVLAFCASLLFFSACDKESDEILLPSGTYSAARENAQYVRYSINGECYHVIIHNREDVVSLTKHLLTLARQGYNVNIGYEGENTANAVAAKDVVKYSTTNEDDMAAWSMKMAEQGYTVYYDYDAETGIFTGTAVKD